MNSNQWAVVVVPFPFTDRDARKRRPAVILSNRDEFGVPTGHSVLAMITSAAHARWPLDVILDDVEAAGLPAPSLIRMKLFTFDDRLILRQLGALGDHDREAARQALKRLHGG